MVHTNELMPSMTEREILLPRLRDQDDGLHQTTVVQVSHVS
jgi:hypothetical protein